MIDMQETKKARKVYLLPAMILASIAACDCSGDNDGSGDYDGTCYQCTSICSSCDAAHEQTCMTECEDCQGYSDCFMWLESRLEGWQCQTGHTHWVSESCP